MIRYAVWTLPTLIVMMMMMMTMMMMMMSVHKKGSLYWLIVKPYKAQGFA